jgi:hypothetical protein
MILLTVSEKNTIIQCKYENKKKDTNLDKDKIQVVV